jgi:fatty acid desaturase
MDIELTLFPTYQFLPNRPKAWFQRKFSILYSHLIYATGFWMDAGKRVYHIAQGKKGLRTENLLVLVELLGLMWVGDGIWTGVRSWLWIHTVSSFVLLSIGATAAHHHPDIFHDGDEPLPDPDFGIGQLDATRDRAENIFQNLFVTLITFGNHPLHHLFPTVCHSKLPYLREVFEQTVREFKLNYPGIPQLELYMGCYQQLARTEVKMRGKKID